MKIEQFLEHHDITENPFSEEDATSDHVFQQKCLNGTRHPAWDKLYSNPEHPSTSVVFGEKGSGKTALRLQIAAQLRKHNQENEDNRVFIIDYDDFNPLLDCFRERFTGRKRKPEKVVSYWRLWDHMDSILKLGVTQLVDAILETSRRKDASNKTVSIDPDRITDLTLLQKRDLLILTAYYDHTLDLPKRQRWRQLRRKIRFSTWKSEWDRAVGMVVSAVMVFLLIRFAPFREALGWSWSSGVFAAGWLPWFTRQLGLFWKSWRVSKQIRVFDHLVNDLRVILSRFERQHLAGQPIPSKDRSDDRYELLAKFQSILQTLGYSNVTVLIDRIDEPHLINGNAERMRDLLWPIFDNKFLKHPGMAFKLLLPSEVVYFLNREEKEFYERSRLDKQNLISSLEWSGESLYDVVCDRIDACMSDSQPARTVRDLFDESITNEELIAIFARMRVPRHLFKFMHRLLVDHCSRFTEDNPSWTINRETLQTSLALYMRDLEAFDRGAGTG